MFDPTDPQKTLSWRHEIMFNVFMFWYIGNLLAERCQKMDSSFYRMIECYWMPSARAIKLIILIVISQYFATLIAEKMMIILTTFSLTWVTSLYVLCRYNIICRYNSCCLMLYYSQFCANRYIEHCARNRIFTSLQDLPCKSSGQNVYPNNREMKFLIAESEILLI